MVDIKKAFYQVATNKNLMIASFAKDLSIMVLFVALAFSAYFYPISELTIQEVLPLMIFSMVASIVITIIMAKSLGETDEPSLIFFTKIACFVSCVMTVILLYSENSDKTDHLNITVQIIVFAVILCAVISVFLCRVLDNLTSPT